MATAVFSGGGRGTSSTPAPALIVVSDSLDVTLLLNTPITNRTTCQQ
ncbi:MAG: hypothetical protein ACREMM_12720 [Gemmatimonadales bacterium]